MTMDYEEKLKALTPERKNQLWNLYKDLNLKKETKMKMVYYKAIGE